QAHQDRRELHRRHLALHHLPHEVDHLVVEDLALVAQAVDRFVGREHRGGPQREMKFLSKAWPCSVNMDSGWNCTPSTGSEAWRTPMISPSSVHAVTSS